MLQTLRAWAQNLVTKAWNHRTWLAIVGVASFFILVLISSADPTWAQTTGSGSTASGGGGFYSVINSTEEQIKAGASTASGIGADIANSLGNVFGRAIAAILLMIARLFLALTTFFINVILVIAGYNGYLESTAVNLGWTVIRDITNMFYIVILLVIAFATILGVEGYEWRQLLPKLVGSAILVNFSRTICGFLIDGSQVIMITFLNAMSATIGGNVINAFKLPSFEKFHSAVDPNSFASPGILVSSIVALIFSALVMAVVGAYVFILLARLIRLWVLIVLSPLVFVLRVLPSTAGFVSEWWTQLTDDLVTGPVLVFFLWLSLIVVGSGQINQEVIKGSRLADKSPIEQAFGAQEQKYGPTDILGANNLANFFIAIGMLLAGAKAASKIGGSSGNLINSAMNTGWQIAKIATGAYIGSRIAQSGKSAAGSVFSTVMSPVTKLGKKAGLRLGAWKEDKIDTWRDKKAKEWSQKGQAWGDRFGIAGRVAGALLPGLASSVIQSKDRGEAIMGKYEEYRKQASERHKTLLGTSVEGISKKVIHGAQQLKKIQEEDAASGALKRAEIERTYEEASGKIGGFLKPHEDRVAEAKKELDKAEKTGNSLLIEPARAQLKSAEAALKKEMANLKEAGYDSKYIRYYELDKAATKADVKSQEALEIIQAASAQQKAEERDALRVARGERPVYVQEFFSSQEKKRTELLGNYSDDELVAEIGKLSDSLRDVNTRLANVKDQDERDSLQDKIKGQTIEMARLQSEAARRGGAQAQSARKAAAATFTDDISLDDAVGQQAMYLSGVLGKSIQATEASVKAAFDELKERFGTAYEFNAYMKNLVDRERNAMSSGALGLGATIRPVYDDAAKQMTYKPVSMRDRTVRSGSTDAQWMRDNRTFAAGNWKLAKTVDFEGSLDRRGGKYVISSPTAVRAIADKFGSLKGEQINKIQRHHVERLKEAIKNMNDAEVRNFVQAMAARFPQDPKKFAQNFGTLLSRIDNGRIRDLFKDPALGAAGTGYRTIATKARTGKSFDEVMADVESTYAATRATTTTRRTRTTGGPSSRPASSP